MFYGFEDSCFPKFTVVSLLHVKKIRPPAGCSQPATTPSAAPFVIATTTSHSIVAIYLLRVLIPLGGNPRASLVLRAARWPLAMFSFASKPRGGGGTSSSPVAAAASASSSSSNPADDIREQVGRRPHYPLLVFHDHFLAARAEPLPLLVTSGSLTD